MNICLLNDSFPPEIDGVANAVVNYAEILSKHGSNPVVVTPKYPEADDSSFSFPVLRYPGIDVRDKVGYMAGYPFSPKVISQLENRKIEVLHTHCPISSTILARSLKDRLDVPVILTYHTKFDIDIANAIKGRLIQQGAVRALVENVSACDEVWTVSAGAAENLKSLGYEGECIVMHNGVDMPKGRLPEERVYNLTKAVNFPCGVPVFLFVGRLMWYKGIRIILDALAGLKSQNIDFRMLFIGNGTDRQEIEQYTAQLMLDEKVFFLGPVYDRETLSAWYCRADLFLFPSSFDTNGLVVREAAAHSLASVIISGSCAAEGVENGKNGFLIEENAVSLAVLLTRLIENREQMKRCGESAAEELYLSWEQAVHMAEDRYRVVIENYRSGRYKRRRRPMDEFFSLQGELMGLFAQAEQDINTLETIADRYLDRYL